MFWSFLEYGALVVSGWFYLSSWRYQTNEAIEAATTRNAIFCILVAIYAHIHLMGN